MPRFRPLLDRVASTCLVILVAGCGQQMAELEPAAVQFLEGPSLHQSNRIDLGGFSAHTLLVRVEGFEAEFQSSVVSQSGELLSLARLPYMRNGPVFHLVDRESGEKPVGVVVQALERSRNSRISAQVYELEPDSRSHRARIEAYRAYEAATQSTTDESTRLWRERAEMLESAASGFKRAGDTEERLWAEYLEAFVHYFPLAEYTRAVERAREIQTRARKHGFRDIALMAMQLEGQALIERNEGDSLAVARQKAERAQSVLDAAANLADEMGYQYERAWALNTRGIGYFYQDRYPEAEEQYERALQIALEIQDSTLPKQVRGNLALVRERQGDLRGSLAEMLAINAELQEGGAAAELAHNWSELSRLYQRLYLFPEAVEAQSRELELWRGMNSAEGMGRAGLSLAHSYYAMGRPQGALPALREAMKNLEQARYARGLKAGFRLMADIHRALGQFDDMAAARERQFEYLTSESDQARYRYEQGLDAAARFAGKPAKAARHFEAAETLARASGNQGLQLLARLQGCANVPASANACAATGFWQVLDEWLPTAPPSRAFEARYLRARVLSNLGHAADARRMLDTLIDDIQLFRNTLPGVLGAWYWESRARIFETYLSLALRQPGERSASAARSLLAFNRLLNTSLVAEGRLQAQAGSPENSDLDELRGLLARLDSGAPEEAAEVRQAIDRLLLGIDRNAAQPTTEFTELEFRAALDNLPPDSAMLAFYLSTGNSWAWLADQDDIRVFPLGSGKDIQAALSRARSGLRVVGNDRLDEDLQQVGDLLLGPLPGELPDTLFLLSAGPLAGFPFEALRSGGRIIGQDHTVVNVLSAQALQRIAQPAGRTEAWQKILLVGNPSQAQAGRPQLPSSARELDGLARLFDDRDITRRTGQDLAAGLTQDEKFTTADVIHVSSHATINLEYPELSRLFLSPRQSRAGYLTPLELAGLTIQADLVVLSACETSGVNRFSFDSNLGFVHAFLGSGAGAVVATLWPVADAFAADFVLDFYTEILSGANTPVALARVKRSHITEHSAGRRLDWPSFQVYIN